MSRRIKRAPVGIFNLAFLDIISCAFGAVVMLVLLAKNGDSDTEFDTSAITERIAQLVLAREMLEQLQQDAEQKSQNLQRASEQSSQNQQQNDSLNDAIPRAQQTLKQLQQQAANLELQINRARARLQAQQKRYEPSKEAGGIPTDADYVIFIIDNSGSMAGRGWQRVVDVVSNIMTQHPAMKGFQIMAADGTFLFSSKQGGWLSDSPGIRRTALRELVSFTGGSSAPEVGIKKALKLYKRQQGRVSIYVFGDDYRPSNLDAIVGDITQLNRDANGQPKIRIHGIGFSRMQGNAEQFAAFMQALAKRNRGAFVGLNY